MKNIYRTIGACLLTAAISTAASSCKKQEPAAPPTPEQKAQIEEKKKSVEESQKVFAAKVNGVDITMRDLIREMNLIAQRDVKGEGKISSKTMDKVKKEALNELIFKELAVQEANKQKLTVAPERIDAVVKEMKTQMGPGAFEEYLDERALSEAELRKLIERGHLLEMITAKEIYSRIKIDDKAVRVEYEKNKSAYKDASGQQLSYDEAANIIKRKLTSEAGAEKKKEWEKTLRKNAKIVIAKGGGK